MKSNQMKEPEFGGRKKTGENAQEDPQVNAGGCNRRKCICVSALVLLIVGIAGVTATCFILEQKVLQYQHHYGVIFDAGSSHTDVTVYRWPSDRKDHGTAHTEQIAFKKCADHGISFFEREPSGAGKMVRACIEDVVLKAVPQKDIKKATIDLGATAGMRLLCERNKKACTKILDSVRTTFNSFKFRQTQNRVSVLTGKEEGTFGFVSANLLREALSADVDPHENTKIVGALDMGGGSAEVTFLPEKGTVIPKAYTSYTKLFGQDYNLYTHSYLCYGFREAERRVMARLVEAANYTNKVFHPCFQKGYNRTIKASSVWLGPCSTRPKSNPFPIHNETGYQFIGNGSIDACENRIKELFNFTAPCPFDKEHCSFDGIYQPPPNGNFVAFSGFGYIADFLNITNGLPISTLKTRGDKICNKTWSEFLSEDNPKADIDHSHNYCFQSTYSHIFLTNGLKFRPSRTDVQFTREIKGKEVGWSIGYMVNATNSIPNEKPTYSINRQEIVALLVGCGLLSLIGVVMLAVFCVKRNKERTRKGKYEMIN